MSYMCKTATGLDSIWLHIRVYLNLCMDIITGIIRIERQVCNWYGWTRTFKKCAALCDVDTNVEWEAKQLKRKKKSGKMWASSVAWRTGDEGSNTPSLYRKCTFPVYHDPLMSSGMLVKSTTDGITLSRVKSGSSTWNWDALQTKTCCPRSTAARRQAGSPTLTQCLINTCEHDIPTNAQSILGHIAEYASGGSPPAPSSTVTVVPSSWLAACQYTCWPCECSDGLEQIAAWWTLQREWVCQRAPIWTWFIKSCTDIAFATCTTSEWRRWSTAVPTPSSGVSLAFSQNTSNFKLLPAYISFKS